MNMPAGNSGVRGASLTPTVIVVGAGFGGLAAARYLHNSNLEVRFSGIYLITESSI